MVQQSYEDIIGIIQKSTDLSKEEIEVKVNNKLKDLQDLVSREGAAHIVANELKVKLFDNTPKQLKIKDILPGMNSVTILCKVIANYGAREFKTSTRSGKVMNLFVGDETAPIRVVVWDETIINSLEHLNESDILKIRNGYSKQNNKGYMEIHLGSKSQITVNPEGETIGDVKISLDPIRKQIKDVQENELTEILGTVVQVFDPKYYQACPECNKKVNQEESIFTCEQHGSVVPNQLPILNLFLDDSTGVIRVVLFRDNAEKLIGNNINNFEELSKNLSGKQLILQGKIVKNTFFDRMELIANSVEETDPEELLKEIKK